MSKLEDLNRRWIKGVHEGLESLEESVRLEVMQPAAANCAADIMKLCEECLGRPVESVEDLVAGWNRLRSIRGLTGSWVYEDDAIKGIFGECGCILVRSGLIELHPVQCCCSQSMMDTVFTRAAQKDTRVKMPRCIGRGDPVCEFIVPRPAHP